MYCYDVLDCESFVDMFSFVLNQIDDSEMSLDTLKKLQNIVLKYIHFEEEQTGGVIDLSKDLCADCDFVTFKSWAGEPVSVDKGLNAYVTFEDLEELMQSAINGRKKFEALLNNCLDPNFNPDGTRIFDENGQRTGECLYGVRS